ncbi:hypothetical protein PRIPAC_90636 [Pristionchus pacificus]|uniref:Uncharacterized protein n=1 Tax=Pristionchus pacificus TaxID=54126 RepID=A0A2A6CW23_PRIPA|nr:hypothetical protein PRIPAC_90636 [Pristionchus pacificus]|eukprot:PDM82432.1 hypothetical protein PRIPAC_36825 [Pristionchus pacificus]
MSDATTSPSCSPKRRPSRSRSRKPHLQFNTLNEAKVVLEIIENRVRNMGDERGRIVKMEKQLTRLNKSIEDQGDMMKIRVRTAEEEMRGRLGLETEPGWGQIRRMKWGSEMGSISDESSISLTRTERSRSTSGARGSLSASSIERSEGTSVRERSMRETLLQQVPEPPKRRVNPVACSRYDEAIKHLEQAAAHLKQIAVVPIREDDKLLAHGASVRQLMEQLKLSKEQFEY